MIARVVVVKLFPNMFREKRMTKAHDVGLVLVIMCSASVGARDG